MVTNMSKQKTVPRARPQGWTGRSMLLLLVLKKAAICTAAAKLSLLFWVKQPLNLCQRCQGPDV